MPEKIELKLSDAYERYTREPALELRVTVLNINTGMNEELKTKCSVLDECISENILKDFLMTQKAEVCMISLYEYDEERELQLIKESWKEAGLEEGRAQGRAEGKAEGRTETIISLCVEFGCSKEQIVEKLIEKCQISKEEAEEKAKNIE